MTHIGDIMEFLQNNAGKWYSSGDLAEILNKDVVTVRKALRRERKWNTGLLLDYECRTVKDSNRERWCDV